MVPLNALYRLAISVGTTIQTTEGINKYLINSGVVTFLPIHSMVVVTSPMGDQAPPAFAATIMSPANQRRVLRS